MIFKFALSELGFSQRVHFYTKRNNIVIWIERWEYPFKSTVEEFMPICTIWSLKYFFWY